MTAYCRRCNRFYSPARPNDRCPVCGSAMEHRSLFYGPSTIIVNGKERELGYDIDMAPDMVVFKMIEEHDVDGTWVKVNDSYHIGSQDYVEAWGNDGREQKDMDSNDIIEFIDRFEDGRRYTVRYTWDPDSIHLLNKKGARRSGGRRCR